MPTPPRQDWRSLVRERIRDLAPDVAPPEDVIEEIAQHLEGAELDWQSRGVDAAEARARVLAGLEDETFLSAVRRRAVSPARSSLALDHARDDSGWRTTASLAESVREMLRDVRFGVRSLSRERGFTAFVVITLALGLGANAAMFGLVDRLLLRGPMHVRDAGQVRRVIATTHPPGRSPQRSGYFGYAAYETFRADTQFLAGAAAYRVHPGGAVLGGGEGARPINSGFATADFFPLLGVRPALGRFFSREEDDPDNPRAVVVLGHGLWQSSFGARGDIVGTTIFLDHKPHTVIGVAPKGFNGVDLAPVDAWRPESGAPHSTNWRAIWRYPWLGVVVRLKPGIPVDQAGAALTRAFRAAYPGRDTVLKTAVMAVEPTHYTLAGTEAAEARVSRWLSAVAGIVLLIACANVVNLLLARTVQRRHELAVRLALGASRWRLARLLVLEVVVLTVAGGVAGIVLAYGLGSAARSLIPDINWVTGPVDPRVLWATLGLVVLTCLVVAMVPAVEGTKAGLHQALVAGARLAGGRTGWFRTALTIAQAALSVVLLAGAGLFLQSLRHLRSTELGIDVGRVLVFEPQRMGIGYYFSDSIAQRRELARLAAFLPMIAERLAARPDIERVAIAGGVPFNRPYEEVLRVPGRDSVPPLPGGGPFASAVSSEYFATVGTRILRGRSFTLDDRAGSAPVAVISETTARTLWPGENPLGRCLVVAAANQCAEVVGVAENTKRNSLRDEEAMHVYVPLDQRAFGARERLVVRPRDGVPAGIVVEAVRRELLAADPMIWHVDVDVLQERLLQEMRPWRLGATIFTLFGVLALLVACVGLYSVISYLVTRRRRELGVRIALGARPVDVARLVMGNGLILAGTGVVIGLALSLVGVRALAPLLFGVSPRDPLVFVAVPLIMTAVAALATLVPALRAGRIDPLEAVRTE